jgi:hypothetical protein
MSKIVRVHGGDYKIIVGSDVTYGNILLDTNPTGLPGTQGEVRITGDLVVEGNTTTIESETLTVVDNVIRLNVGEGSTNPGVSALGTTSGLDIDRGLFPNFFAVWDETVTSYDPTGALAAYLPVPSNPAIRDINGTFVFRDANSNLRAIATNSINTDGGDLALICSGEGIITVTGTADYERQVLNYSNIGVVLNVSAISRASGVATVITTAPHGLLTGNRASIICYSNATFTAERVAVTYQSATRFTYTNAGPDVTLGPALGDVRRDVVRDDDTIPNMQAIVDYTEHAISTISSTTIRENDTKVQTYDTDTSGVSEITFEVDGVERASVNTYGLNVGNLRFNNNNISNVSNDNILLDNVLNIANKTSVPSTPTGYVKLYSTNVPGNGGTGLYFVNTTGINDELVSKTRALLYALIL